MALSYKVFPGTPYYTTSALTTEAGTIVNTIPATYVNTTYGTVSIGGTTYYVAYGQMISFWNSSFTGQQIDDSITKVRAASATPAQSGTDLFTTGGAYALQTAIGGKADKTELSDISQSGSTCTEANGIAAGLYFYLDGDLVVAKTAIGYGDTFTENTNYETPTAGALNALKSALTWKELGSVTGSTPIYLPSKYEELYAFNNDGYPRFVHIPKAAIQSGSNYFYGGNYQNGTNGATLCVEVDTNASTIKMFVFIANTTNVTSTTPFTVLYR